MTESAAVAEPRCEHYWAYHLHGHLSVRLCQLCHEPDWDDLRGQLAESAAKALLSLAAWFDRKERETAAEVDAHRERDDDDAAIMADGARSTWRDAARKARLRAGAGSDGDTGAVPVSPDAGKAQGHSGDSGAAHEALAAALPEEWVKAAEGWYSMHGSGLVRNLLAGAVPLIQAAERERLADRQQVIDEVKAELDDAFQFTDRDGSRHGYVTRAWVESLLAHHAASAVAAERERLAQLADQKRAGYEDLGTGEPGLAQYGSYVPFADLIREGGDG